MNTEHLADHESSQISSPADVRSSGLNGARDFSDKHVFATKKCLVNSKTNIGGDAGEMRMRVSAKA